MSNEVARRKKEESLVTLRPLAQSRPRGVVTAPVKTSIGAMVICPGLHSEELARRRKEEDRLRREAERQLRKQRRTRTPVHKVD